MPSSKIRTSIITLVAALSFAGVAVIPTASQAATKESKTAVERKCEAYYKGFENAVNGMEQGLKEGNSALLNESKQNAESWLNLYEATGCDSALGRTLPPMPSHVVVRVPVAKPVSSAL